MSVFRQLQQELLEIGDNLTQYQRQHDEERAKELSEKLKMCKIKIDAFASKVSSENHVHKKLWMERANQLVEEHNSAQKTYNQAYNMFTKHSRHLEERKRLFENRKASPMDASILNALEKEKGSIHRTSNVLEETTNTARSVMLMLGDQRQSLMASMAKSEKMRDVLALSKSTMNVIKRRIYGDKALVYIFMAIVILILVGLLMW
eukprot:TRINITY_DN12194_c0_g1_i1.p1 TRINITY_DN12194_c0_g1~~TRINITY_DN12194_c0_g1_i1.p1  ORF type:complete len:205 (-),score=35.13 TRINITY_DN12194_c0_g1_i1:80-694(-)